MLKRQLKSKPMLKEDAMQRSERLERLVDAGERAKKQLSIVEKDKDDVNKHKWKGSM